MATDKLMNHSQGESIITNLGTIATNLQNVTAISPAKFGMGYAVCDTAAGTAAKTANIANYVLTEGALVTVKFTNANTASNATLNLNNTGAKPILYKGSALTTDIISAGDICTFIYSTANSGSYNIINVDALSGAGAGTVKSVGAEGGLTTDQTSGAAISTTGNVKLNLKSDTAFQATAPDPVEIENKIYPVALDASGHPAVSVPGTTYTEGTGIDITNNVITNAGVTAVTASDSSTGTDGTISVTTNGTTAEVAVKGLNNAAYKDISTAIPATGAVDTKVATEKAVADSISGKAIGTNSSTTNAIATFAGTDGKTLADSAVTIAKNATGVTDDDTKVPTSKAVKTYVDATATGISRYIGTITAASQLSTTAKKGDFYIVSTAWTGVHAGDEIIAEKDNPTATIDGTNWTLLHNEADTNTTYTFAEGTTNGKFTVTPSDTGTAQSVTVHGLAASAYKGVDTTPTASSSNLVESGGVATALGNKQDTLTFDGTYNASTNKAATVSTVTNAIGALDVSEVSVGSVKTINKISQTDGKISVSTTDIRSASTSQTGIVQLNDAINNTSTTQAATANAVKKVNDKVETNKSNILYAQESTIGENLIPCPYYRSSGYTEDDVIYTYDNDGIININGTASNDSYFVLANSIHPETIGDTFTISTASDNANSAVKYRCYYVNDAGEGVGGNIVFGFVNRVASFTYNPPENYSKIAIAVYLVKNTEAINEKITVMLEKGSVAHPYQPYKLSRQNLYKESYQTTVLSDKIVRLKENKDGYAYITSAAGDVIKSVGKNLVNPEDYDYTLTHFSVTSDSDGYCTISGDGTPWTSNGYISSKITIPITKTGTLYFVCEHISGYAYRADVPYVVPHQTVFFDKDGNPIGSASYNTLSMPAEIGKTLIAIPITEDLVQYNVAYFRLAIWLNGSTNTWTVDNYKYRVACYLDNTTVTADTPYQPYKESIKTCEASGHCYIMTYEDGSVYSQNDYPINTITVDYPESDFAVRFNESEKATDGIDKSNVNYIEMKSGQRVYADTEEPYGNIEVGSIGVGFESGLREFGAGAKKSATTFPVTFGTDGTPITNYTVYGNTGGVGDRSANFVDRMNIDAVELYPNQNTGTVETTTGSSYSIIIPVSSLTDCFFSINRETTAWTRCRLAGYATYPEVGTTATFVDNTSANATDDTSGNYSYNSCEIPSGTNYIMVFLASGMSSISSVDIFREAVKASKPMLTSGTEKLPYVKYYSIPVTCNSVTSQISLDAPLAAGESVTYAQSGSAIATVDGQNTMTFGSTVSPSGIDFEYVGWHPTGEIADLIAGVEALDEQNYDLTRMVSELQKKAVKVYTYHVNPNESDPEDAVTYLDDATGLTPAKMGASSFSYGSWANAWFLPRPCMLKSDGTVAYYLNPNDYSKKTDGTASDIADLTFDGNVMLEFPKIWVKRVAGSASGERTVSIAPINVDGTYKCWSNINAEDKEVDHFYLPAYNGTIDNNSKMRSMSDITLSGTAPQTSPYAYAPNYTRAQEVTAATANNPTGKNLWYTETWADFCLIYDLLYLMGKSLDVQRTFGQGLSSGSETATRAYVTGTHNAKGLFYGDISGTSTAVKVLGMENLWGCRWHGVAGLINDNGTLKVKMTYGVADGSTTVGYNTTGSGYLNYGSTYGTSGYVKKMQADNIMGYKIIETAGTDATYYCDYYYANNSQSDYALLGGSSGSDAYCGFYVGLGHGAAYAGWAFGGSLSCRS